MGRVVRDEQGQEWEQLPSGEWVPYDPLASRTGALETGLVQAGAQLARFGRGAQNIYANVVGDWELADELRAEQAESDRLLGGLSDYSPIASTVGTMAPALATMPLTGGLGTAALLGAAEGALSYRPDLREQLLLGGVTGAAFSAGGFAAGNLASRVAGKIRGLARAGREGSETTGNVQIFRESVAEAQERGRLDIAEAEDLLANEPGRRATPLRSMSPAQREAAAEGQRLGWRFEAADFNEPLNQVRAAAQSNPLTSGLATANQRANFETLENTIARGIGLPDGRGLGANAIGDAEQRLGETFQRLQDTAGDVNLSRARSLAQDIVDEGKRGIGAQGEGIQRAEQLLAQTEGGTTIDPGDVMLWRSELMANYRQATSPMSPRADTVAAQRLEKLIEAVDDAFERAVPAAQRNLYKKTREQYRLLRTIRKGAAINEAGDVNVRSLGNQLRRNFRREYGEGRDQALEESVRDALRITRVANTFAPNIGDSGTATRLALQQMEPTTMAMQLATRPMGAFYGRAMQVDPTTPGMYGLGVPSAPGSVGAAIGRGLWAAGAGEL
jgi:hypothetical protein